MWITWIVTGIFLSMAVYLCVYAVTHKQAMVNNSYNGLQQILMKQNTRGQILANNGEVLAETRTDATGKETRVYPYQSLFAHAVGFAVNGKAGIEAQANYYLLQSGATLAERAENAMVDRKNPGDCIHTTLQVDLQETAAKALGVYKGAIIVTEPATGKILAMVSKPDFNPEEIPLIWDEIIADKESTVLLNRTTQGLYPPGSTFKIITALEYIRENGTDLSSYRFDCPGHFTRDGERINCYHGIAHGQEDFTLSFAKSCNSSFANIGVSLDGERFSETLQTLLFNQELPLPLNYNKSRAVTGTETTMAELMQLSIGQGTTQITPIHLNMITCAVANGGTVMKPYLIDAVKTAGGNVVKQFSPTVYRELMSEEEAAVLRQLMESVVEKGTATRLQEAAYTAAGKTGSAEFGQVKGESHAWFTGYAPAENPRICVTVIIEGAGAGGEYAVPMAKRIFDTYLGADSTNATDSADSTDLQGFVDAQVNQ